MFRVKSNRNRNKKGILYGGWLFSILIAVVVLSACNGTSEASPVPSAATTTETTLESPAKPIAEPETTTSASPVTTPTTNPEGPIKAKWIEPVVQGDTVLLPVAEIEDNYNIHFKLDNAGGDMNFMAYVLDGETHIRANVCPPCRSIGFSLDDDILVCNRCRTLFDAETGNGISGACVNYPKASLAYQGIDGNLIMTKADLIEAYQETLEKG